MIKGQAAVHRCSAEVDFGMKSYPFFPATVNSGELHERFTKVAGEMIGPQNVRHRPPIMGSEDFSFFGEVVPAAFYYFVGTRDESQPPPPPPHSPLFTINEAALPYGAALHAALAAQYLADAAAPPRRRGVHDEL